MVLERYRINNKGFTLVELMTVVAIIGALAALGVPQYRKMQRKAKRAEASMGLGVIASAEAAFFAEYNGYGDSLAGIGAEMDTAPQYYNMGFLNNAAPHGPRINTAAGAGAGFRFCETSVGCAQLNPRTFNGYQTATVGFPDAANVRQYVQRSVSGFQAMQPTADGLGWQVLSTAGGRACAFAGDANNVVAMAGDNATFQAVAAGNLYWNNAATTSVDCLTIDRQRTINLRQDGT
ncbi:prepilin-type N-terminal cleavage/methylation domain-containing protein [bacterium]|nr:prepilin-type N-terminal cleavage/methylation domain-containing protein [bacterium]